MNVIGQTLCKHEYIYICTNLVSYPTMIKGAFGMNSVLVTSEKKNDIWLKRSPFLGCPVGTSVALLSLMLLHQQLYCTHIKPPLSILRHNTY